MLSTEKEPFLRQESNKEFIPYTIEYNSSRRLERGVGVSLPVGHFDIIRFTPKPTAERFEIVVADGEYSGIQSEQCSRLELIEKDGVGGDSIRDSKLLGARNPPSRNMMTLARGDSLVDSCLSLLPRKCCCCHHGVDGLVSHAVLMRRTKIQRRGLPLEERGHPRTVQ